MAFGTSYSIDNDQRFRLLIRNWLKATDDLRPAFILIRRDFYKSQKSIWRLKGPGQYPDYKNGVDGPYARWKESEVGFRYPLLKLDGDLELSLSRPRAPGAISSATKKELIIGTEIEYGIFHQSDRPRRVIPQRKFLFIGPEAKRFNTPETAGRLERWTNIMNVTLTRKLEFEKNKAR